MSVLCENRHERRMSEDRPNSQCVEDFKNTLFKMQEVRRALVASILNDSHVDHSLLDTLSNTLNELTDSRTTGEMRHISTQAASFPINIRDEIRGLKKDVEFVSRLSSDADASISIDEHLNSVDLSSILAPYHTLSSDKYYEELENCTRFLMSFVESSTNSHMKPMFITDWDGTMKDYCAQYATNLQPVYSAVMMGRFSTLFTRISAVLTAGPLRGPGILDLTSLPINGPVLFSGSWGREWWLKGRRVVHEDGITDEAFDALGRLSDEMADLIHSSEFAQFALVGSGVQKKVDRLTLGVQTVFGHVPEELTSRYIEAVKERIHRVDPNSQTLKLEDHNHLEIEVCAHSNSSENGASKVWDKADGVAALVTSLGDSLEKGIVLVAGDTTSDLPMLRQVVESNPKGAMALFVGANAVLQEKVLSIVGDPSRACFISCPDVAHGAFSRVIQAKLDVD